MSDNTVIAINAPEIAAALERAPERLIPALRTAVEKWLLRRVGELARYPAPPSGSTYDRTGTLGRAWTAAKPTWQASASGFSARLGNKTPYAPYVQGSRQAAVHRGRWGTAEEVAQQGAPELSGELVQAVVDLANELNGLTR